MQHSKTNFKRTRSLREVRFLTSFSMNVNRFASIKWRSNVVEKRFLLTKKFLLDALTLNLLVNVICSKSISRRAVTSRVLGLGSRGSFIGRPSFSVFPGVTVPLYINFVFGSATATFSTPLFTRRGDVSRIFNDFAHFPSVWGTFDPQFLSKLSIARNLFVMPAKSTTLIVDNTVNLDENSWVWFLYYVTYTFMAISEGPPAFSYRWGRLIWGEFLIICEKVTWLSYYNFICRAVSTDLFLLLVGMCSPSQNKFDVNGLKNVNFFGRPSFGLLFNWSFRTYKIFFPFWRESYNVFATISLNWLWGLLTFWRVDARAIVIDFLIVPKFINGSRDQTSGVLGDFYLNSPALFTLTSFDALYFELQLEVLLHLYLVSRITLLQLYFCLTLLTSDKLFKTTHAFSNFRKPSLTCPYNQSDRAGLPRVVVAFVPESSKISRFLTRMHVLPGNIEEFVFINFMLKFRTLGGTKVSRSVLPRLQHQTARLLRLAITVDRPMLRSIFRVPVFVQSFSYSNLRYPCVLLSLLVISLLFQTAKWLYRIFIYDTVITFLYALWYAFRTRVRWGVAGLFGVYTSFLVLMGLENFVPTALKFVLCWVLHLRLWVFWLSKSIRVFLNVYVKFLPIVIGVLSVILLYKLDLFLLNCVIAASLLWFSWKIFVKWSGASKLVVGVDNYQQLESLYLLDFLRFFVNFFKIQIFCVIFAFSKALFFVSHVCYVCWACLERLSLRSFVVFYLSGVVAESKLLVTVAYTCLYFVYKKLWRFAGFYTTIKFDHALILEVFCSLIVKFTRYAISENSRNFVLEVGRFVWIDRLFWNLQFGGLAWWVNIWAAYPDDSRWGVAGQINRFLKFGFSQYSSILIPVGAQLVGVTLLSIWLTVTEFWILFFSNTLMDLKAFEVNAANFGRLLIPGYASFQHLFPVFAKYINFFSSIFYQLNVWKTGKVELHLRVDSLVLLIRWVVDYTRSWFVGFNVKKHFGLFTCLFVLLPLFCSLWILSCLCYWFCQTILRLFTCMLCFFHWLVNGFCSVLIFLTYVFGSWFVVLAYCFPMTSFYSWYIFTKCFCTIVLLLLL